MSILLNDDEIPAIEDILIKYKKSLHKEWALRKSEANIDFRNFAAHELRDLIAKAQLKRVVETLDIDWLIKAISRSMWNVKRDNVRSKSREHMALLQSLLKEAE